MADEVIVKNPVSGKYIYFHQESVIHNDAWCKDVTARLTRLGGLLLPYFSREVDIVVHNRCLTPTIGTNPAATSTAVLSPSCFAIASSSPQQLTGAVSGLINGTSVSSPFTPMTPSPVGGDGSTASCSLTAFGKYARPERLMQLRRNKQQTLRLNEDGLHSASNDILDRARNIGCQVYHVNKVREWLKHPTVARLVKLGGRNENFSDFAPLPLLSDANPTDHNTNVKKNRAADKAVGLRHLRPLCVKISDLFQCHRPLFREKMVKKCYFAGFKLGSPGAGANASKVIGVTASAVNQPTCKVKTPVAMAACRYCEACDVMFADLMTHLRGVQHKKFASFETNFADLDAMISVLPTVDAFFNSEAKRLTARWAAAKATINGKLQKSNVSLGTVDAATSAVHLTCTSSLSSCLDTFCNTSAPVLSSVSIEFLPGLPTQQVRTSSMTEVGTAMSPAFYIADTSFLPPSLDDSCSTRGPVLSDMHTPSVSIALPPTQHVSTSSMTETDAVTSPAIYLEDNLLPLLDDFCRTPATMLFSQPPVRSPQPVSTLSSVNATQFSLRKKHASEHGQHVGLLDNLKKLASSYCTDVVETSSNNDLKTDRKRRRSSPSQLLSEYCCCEALSFLSDGEKNDADFVSILSQSKPKIKSNFEAVSSPIISPSSLRENNLPSQQTLSLLRSDNHFASTRSPFTQQMISNIEAVSSPVIAPSSLNDLPSQQTSTSVRLLRSHTRLLSIRSPSRKQIIFNVDAVSSPVVAALSLKENDPSSPPVETSLIVNSSENFHFEEFAKYRSPANQVINKTSRQDFVKRRKLLDCTNSSKVV